jgi:hypothetical protein
MASIYWLQNIQTRAPGALLSIIVATHYDLKLKNYRELSSFFQLLIIVGTPILSDYVAYEHLSEIRIKYIRIFSFSVAEVAAIIQRDKFTLFIWKRSKVVQILYFYSSHADMPIEAASKNKELVQRFKSK